MKKFMIFLLMTFLYLGTCQARSEASYPKDANPKLLSWISPTPSQSFLKRVTADYAFNFVSPTSATVYLGVSSNNSVTFTRPSAADFITDYEGSTRISSMSWKIDGTEVSSDKSLTSYTVSGLAPGNHTFACVVTSTSGAIYTASANIIVSEEDILVNIVGLEEACQGTKVTLTAVIEAFGSSVTGFQYLWYKDGEAVAGETSQTFTVEADGQNHDYVVEVTREGCKSTKSPVHYLNTIEQPTITLELPEYVCEETGATTTITAQVLAANGTQPTMYKWFTKNGTTIEALATTVENYYFIENATLVDNESIGVQAIFANSCNTDTVFVESKTKYYEGDLKDITLEANDGEVENNDAVCVNTEVKFSFDDENTTLGTPTYKWYINNALVENANGTEYTANFTQAGTYNIYVEASYADYPCESKKSETFVVKVENAPAVAITGNNVICVGQTATLTATEIEDAESYAWAGPEEITETSNELEVTTPGVYQVTVTTKSGCTATAEFTVYQFGADLQVVASNMNVCEGEYVTLNANLNGWNNAKIAYKWDDEDESETPTISVNEAKTYHVTATALDADDEEIDGCSLTQEITVTNITVETATLEVTIDPEQICVGGQVTATIDDDGDIDDSQLYNWYLNGVQIPGEHMDEITVNLNEVGTYVFAASRQNTVCAAILSDNSDEVEVIAMPSVVITGNNVICQGAEATLTANVIDADYEMNEHYTTDYQYYWHGPSWMEAEMETTEEITVTVPGVYSVTVYAENDFDDDLMTGCVAHAEFTVYQVGGNVQIIPSTTQVCEGQPVVLTANASGFNNQTLAYEWSEGDDDESATVTVFPTEETTYTVTVYAKAMDDDASEDDFEDACKIESSITIYTVETPKITSIDVTEDNICQGGQVHASVEGTSDYYVWYINGVEVPGQNLEKIVVNLNEPGEYAFSAKPAGQCSDNIEATTAEKTVTVFAHPEVYITGEDVICLGDTTTLKPVIVPNDVENYTYAWSNGLATETIKVADAGTYSLNITGDLSKCVASATFSVYQQGGDLHVSADKYEVCAGEMVILTANLDGFQSENIKYAWSTLDTSSVVSTVVNEAKTYVVTAIAGKCSMTDSVKIAITKGKQYQAVVKEMSGKNSVCLGAPIYYEASVEGIENPSFVWYVDGVEVPGENLSTLVVSTNEVGIHTVAAKPVVTGCDTAVLSELVGHIVNAMPEITLTGNNVICNGDTAKVKVNALDDVDYTYNWSNGTTEQTLATTVAGTYTVTATNTISGCVAVADIDVTTFGGDLHVSADKYEVCAGEMVILTANLDGFQSENIKYAWSTLDTSSLVQVTPTETTTYVVTAIAGKCSMTDSVKINVINDPTTAELKVTAASKQLCVGSQATVSVTASDNGAYIWYLNGVEIPGENLSSITMNMNEPGMYIFAATPATTKCVISNTDDMDTVMVYANPVVTLTGDHFYTVDADTAYIIATANEKVDFAWSNGKTKTAAEKDTIKVTDAGIYTVTVTNEYGCSTISDPFQVNAVVNAQVNIVGLDKSCMGDIVTLTAVVDNDLIGISQYQWLVNGQYIQGATQQNFAINTGVLYDTTNLYVHDITVEVTREGCDAITSPVHKLTIRPVPEVVVTAPEYICEGESATFEANVYAIGEEEQFQYVWFQDEISDKAFDTINYINTIEISSDNLTNHKYGVIVNYQDTTCGTGISNFVEVKFYEKPEQIHLTVNADTVCAGTQVIYNLEEVNAALIPHITWHVNGVVVEGADLDNYANIFENEGIYNVFATVNYEGYPCETMVSNDTTIYVFGQPTVQITGDPIICVDSTVNLFAMINDTIGSKDYNYEWRLYNYTLLDGANEPIFSEDNIAITYANDSVKLSTTLTPQDHPYIFTTKITTPTGCVATSEPYYVYVGENPTVAVTVDYDTVCKGGEVTATAHLGNYNMDNLVYQWYENGTLIPHGTSQTYTSTIQETTEFKVVVKQTTTECEATGKDTTFVVIPKELDHIVVINNGEKAKNVCEGAQLEIAAYFKDENGEYYIDGNLDYVWTLNGMQLQTVSGPQFSAQAYIYDNDPVDYVYTAYVVYDVPGCEMVPVASDTIHVRRNPIVTIDGTPNVCYYNDEDPNIVLTAWVDGVYDEDATYTWFESGQLRPNTSGYDNKYAASWIPTYLNPYIFTVEVTNGDGCTTISEPFYVNVYDMPVVNITADADSICEGGSVTLNANLDNYNDPMLTYQWYENALDDVHKMNGYTHENEVVTPNQTTNYIVRVTHLTISDHGGNQSCYALDTFKINVNAVPQITSIDNNIPDVNSVCDGYQVELKANIKNGVQGGEVYTWYRNGEIIANATQETYTEVLSALNEEPTQYTYAVSVKQSASGCESEVFAMNAFTVNPNPVVELTTDPIVCVAAENNIVMAANVYPAPATELKFNWFEDNVLIEENYGDTLKLTKPYRDYAYNFSVQLVNEYGCISESAASVYVNAAPVVNITATETDICEGGEITLTASLNDWNADQLTFQWYDNDELIAGATSLTYTVAPALGSHDYTVKIKQLTSECEATSNVVKVNVNTIPVITSVTVNDYNVCVGGQLTITANTADEAVEGEVYTWYRNGILMEGATGKVINDTPVLVDNNTQQFTYTAVVTRPAAGCTSLPTTSSVVNVFANPVVVITGDQHVCETDSIFLIANVDTNGMAAGSLHYTWYESGQIRDNMAYNLGDSKFFAEYMYARTEPYRFTVDVTRDNTASGCVSHSEVFNVYVYAQPVVNITATETEICENGEVTLTANLNDNNATDIVYQWYKVVETQSQIAVGYNEDGTYQYETVTNVNRENIPGATSANYTVSLAETTTLGVMILQTPSTCTANDEITINVNPIPVVTNVTANQLPKVTVCDGAQVTIAAEINPANAQGAVYTWYRNGQLIEGATEASFSENVYTTDNHITTNTYTAIVTLPASGCVSNMSAVSAQVVVNPAPSTVTISGNNVICFGDQTTLTAYSDVEGEFTWSTGSHNEQITVGAGTYTVTMKTAEGCEMTSAPFTVESFGTDLLVSASETNICQGEHTTLYVNQDGWNGNVSYAWDAQAGNSTATTVDVTPDTTTTYKVTATVSNENGSCSKVGEITIVVNPLPAVVTVTASASEVCEGTQVTFTASGNAAGYIWYNNGIEIPGENQNTLTVNFNEEGSYAYSAKAISTEGCVSAQASAPVTVTVNAAPEMVVISGQTVICNGGNTTLYANVTPNANNVTYTWYKDNNAVANSNANYLVVNQAGSYKVEASINGCSSVSDAVVVTVEQAPQLQLTATESTICVGGETVITAEATGWNNANVIYNWNNGYQGSAYTFVPTNAGSHKFIVTASQSTSGCVAVDSIVINVNNVPAAPQIAVDNATICDGGQVQLTITNAVAGATYTWYQNGIEMTGATQSTIFQSPIAVDGDVTTYSYKAIASLPASGCESNISSVATVVTVIPTPVVAVAVNGNTTFCEGGSTTLNANVTPAGINYNYQWYQDNVLIPNATNATYLVTANARETAYNYSVVVTANAGCNVTANAPAITVVADPVVVANVSNDVVCVGGTATFTANVDGGVANVNGLNGYTYAWYNNLSTTEPIATTASYTTTGNEAAGNYSYWVVVTSPYGCQSTSNVVNHIVANDPTVSIAVAQGYPTTVCDGGQTTLIANVNGGYGETTYQWYKNGLPLYGETNMTLATSALNYGEAAAYTVVVKQSGVGCEAVAEAYNVNVAPAYTVDITGFGNVCEGGTLTLTASVNNVISGDVLSYQWYKAANGNNAVAINGATSAQYSTSDLLLGDSYDYYVVVTSNISGCSVTSTTVPANVVSAPSVTIQGANTVCEGGQLTLNAFVNGGVDGSAYTYTWNWTGAANGQTTTATPSYVPTLTANDASTPYYFTVTISRNDNTGCTATSEAHEVNVLAVPSVVVTADNNYICQNGEVTFTAHVSPVGSYNYAWTINGQSQAVNSSSVTTTSATTGNISATVVVSAANASASCSAAATVAVPVQVVAAPTVTIAANHTTMCVGGTTTLTANVNANSNIPSEFNYQWAINGIEVEGAVTSTFVQPLNAAGVYTYTLKVSQNNNLGCTSTWSAPVTVQVAEQPVVSLSSADGLAICEGGSVTLTGVVDNYGNTVNGVTNSNIYGAMTYDWTSNGINVHHNTNISNAQNQVTETLNTVGNYSYQVVVTPSGYNCQPQASNIEVVNVLSNPSWTDVHIYSANGTDACLGEMVTLEAAIQGGASDYAGSTNGHIQWVVTDENGNTMNVLGGLGGNSYDIPATAGTYIYTPTFVGNIGSGCQLSNTSDVQVAVTVHELPTAVFASGDGTSLCANDASASAELVINFTGVAPFNYQVVDNYGNVVAQAVSLANTVTIYVAPSAQTTYFINMVADAFCENTVLDANATATVYVNEVEFEDNFFVSGCSDNGEVTINFNMISGNPTAQFNVVYENGLQASGTISNNSATFAAPTAPGDYNAVFTVDGCSYDIVVRVLVGEYFGGTLPIMDQRWNDVVVVNNNPETNGGHTFVGFQWYKNGVAIPGATYSNYQDKDGLNGFYSVELIEQDANGNMVTFMTCETYFNSVSSVKVYPVPANVRQEITIELDLTSEELEGAVLDIYSVTGAHISHVTDLQPITKIEGFKAQGTYFGRILTGTNEIKTVKFVIVK